MDRSAGGVGAIIYNGHNRRFNEQRGFFGFFESVDDQQAANAAVRRRQRLVPQHSMTTIRGPANPSQNYEVGLLIEGFHSPPTFMITYNKPYYGKLIEGWGFTKSQDMYAFWGHIDMLSKLDRKLWFIATEAMKRFNVKLRPMNARRFRDELEMFLRVYNDSMVGTWGFVPLSAGEIKVLGAGSKHLIVPELSIVAEVDGQAIGACFGLLDYNPRIKKIDGRLFPFGFIHLLRHKRAIQKMRVISINVVPEYQRWGLGVVLLGGLIEPMKALGHEGDRILLGARVEHALARQPGKRGRQAGQDLPRLRPRYCLNRESRAAR